MLSSIFDAGRKRGKVGLTIPILLQELFVPSLNTPGKETKAQRRLKTPYQSPQQPGTAKRGRESLSDFDDAVLLQIFNYLPLVDLARASEVCRRWYRISFDELLWRNVNLRRFGKLLGDEDVFETFVKSRLSTKVYDLDLTGLVLSEKNMNTIAVHCTNLRSLTLKSVTFKNSNPKDGNDTQVLIPKKLQCLDMRFSRGSPSVFSSIACQLHNLQSLGACDGFLHSLIVSAKLESTIASLTNSLENLDMSQCLFVTDSLLELFVHCKKLRVLSLRKCNGVFGNSLQLILQSCPDIETLILDGTSIENVFLEKVKWEKWRLKHLELGWCPLVTSASLKKTLPRIAQIPTLQYLGLCDIGQGKALTDDVLASFAVSLTDRPNRTSRLTRVNIGSSHGITDEVLGRFRKCHLNIPAPDSCTTCCAAPCEVVAPKSHDNINKPGVLAERKGPHLIPKRTILSCCAKFPLPRYALETPL